MTPSTERRLFQLIVVIGSLVPILAGAAGVVRGPAMMRGSISANADLDSHFRYLSGLLLGIGIAYLTTLGDLRRKSGLFVALSLIVILGGCARLFGALLHGFPPEWFAFAMELGVVPLLLLWLRRIVRPRER